MSAPHQGPAHEHVPHHLTPGPGRASTAAVVVLVVLGLGWAPQALATPHVPERGHSTTSYLSAAQLRREAAADRAQHLLWAGGSSVVWLGYGQPASDAVKDRARHSLAADR